MGKNADAQRNREEKSSVKSRFIYDGKYLKVRQDIVDGHTWDIAVNPGAVAVIPIDSQGRIILVQQWRRAIGKITLELPAGMLDADESHIDCAQRELQEETGYKAGKMTPFGGCYSSPGTFTEYLHLFIGENLTESRLHADDTAGIDVDAFFLKELLKMIKNGEISDAKTVVGILRYHSQC